VGSSPTTATRVEGFITHYLIFWFIWSAHIGSNRIGFGGFEYLPNSIRWFDSIMRSNANFIIFMFFVIRIEPQRSREAPQGGRHGEQCDTCSSFDEVINLSMPFFTDTYQT
jgi:hypothetical protein